jgi:putative Holliday junction resolvase
VSAASKVLGVDYGTVRIGLAISDPDRKFAFPLATYTRKGRDKDGDYFRTLVKGEAIGQVLLGLPIHLSGVEGQKAREARAFGRWLSEITTLPILLWDERFTSVEAEGYLLAAGLTKKRRKARRDRVAAQILLQSYLDAGCPGEQRLGPLAE